jgi:hypothetical protein
MDEIVAHRDFNLGAQPERKRPSERDPTASTDWRGFSQPLAMIVIVAGVLEIVRG